MRLQRNKKSNIGLISIPGITVRIKLIHQLLVINFCNQSTLVVHQVVLLLSVDVCAFVIRNFSVF